MWFHPTWTGMGYKLFILSLSTESKYGTFSVPVHLGPGRPPTCSSLCPAVKHPSGSEWVFLIQHSGFMAILDSMDFLGVSNIEQLLVVTFSHTVYHFYQKSSIFFNNRVSIEMTIISSQKYYLVRWICIFVCLICLIFTFKNKTDIKQNLSFLVLAV